MAVSNIRCIGLMKKAFTSETFSISANSKVNITIPAPFMDGYQIIGCCISGGSNVDIRNNLVLYGWPQRSGTGLKLLEVNGVNTSGTVEITVIYAKSDMVQTA